MLLSNRVAFVDLPPCGGDARQGRGGALYGKTFASCTVANFHGLANEQARC